MFKIITSVPCVHRENVLYHFQAANVDFFQILEERCCSSLVHLLFPFHPVFSSVKAVNQTTKEPADEVPLLEMPSEPADPTGEEVKSGGGGGNEHHEQETSDSEQVASPLATSTAPISIPSAGNGGRVDTVGSLGHSVSSTYGASGYQSTLDMMSHEGPEFRSITSEFKSVVSVGIPGEISTASFQDVFSPGGADQTKPQGSGEKLVFLETMLTTESPAGIYPRFPSWSLRRLGSSNGYSPAKGLEQPGFFPNSNFLLAWDIPLLSDSQSDLTSQFDGQGKHLGAKQMTEEAWPTLNELPSAGSNLSSLPIHQALTYARRQCADYKGNTPPLVSHVGSGKGSSSASRQRGRASRDGAVPTVRAYIGEEYECPRGHR